MLRDRRLQVILAALLITAGIWVYALVSRPKLLSVTVMDVGEGLSVVVRSPSGRTLVMDCGTCSWRDNESVGESVVVPYLKSQGVDHIDVAVLSHPHADHVSGYAGLIRAVPARLVLDIGTRSRSPLYRRFLATTKRVRARYRIARRGQNIDLGDGVRALVLSPKPGKLYSDLNERSIVLRITYKRASFLLEGDAGEETEREMIESRMPVRAQVLQVGHHGSADSSSSKWLAAVRPAIAVISCGRRNNYGHPSRKTLSRLASTGARIYRTDRNGAVCLTSDGESITARSIAGPR
ncbi:MAG: MBL fold metallo-hydrolase [Armatimonadetes bacterium]|nr:MBL fold metallo-hydrolase [Armatimonadota bacterium]